jgi:DNA (cytosine-5)-methyltransferase 1
MMQEPNAPVPRALAELALGHAAQAGASISQLDLLRARLFSPSPAPIDLIDRAFSTATQLGLGAIWARIDSTRFTFVDLFAGIGGMRLAAELRGGRCLQSVEWDTACQETYHHNFGEIPDGDITTMTPRSKRFKNHDLLLAGFPCQAFSIAGKRGGFEDTRGTLFRDVAEVISAKKPAAFILENVKGLVLHDKRRTLPVILNTLAGSPVRYHLAAPSLDAKLSARGWAVLNALDFGVPQHRERIFIVGFRDKKAAERFVFPTPATPGTTRKTLQDILEDGPSWNTPVDARHFISEKYLTGLKRHRSHHESKGQGFGYEIRSHDSYANAVVGGGMGRERNLVQAQMPAAAGTEALLKSARNDSEVRRMTPREWARLQGFPEWFQPHPTDTHGYKQLGNAVAVPVVEAVVEQVLRALEGRR